jgi:hypothetical protein
MTILQQIEKIMLKGKWVTIPSLQKRIKTYAMETTISARIRDLRKPKYGSHTVQRRLKKGTKLYEYRVEG